MKLFDLLFAKPARDLEAELAAALAAIDALADRLRFARAQAHMQAGAAYKARADLNDTNAILSRYGAALDAIGATESRNGTAQRLARLAREARE